MGTKSTILLGCLVGILSSATQSVGITLQRKSHINEDTKPKHLPYRPAYKRSLWRLGFLLFLLANIFGSSVQITTLPIIILSPLQAVGLVFNSVCASMILNEPFTQNMITGTILVSVGACIIAFFGSIPEPAHSLLELIQLMKRKAFVCWYLFTIVIVLLLLLWIFLSVNYFHCIKPINFNTDYNYNSIDNSARCIKLESSTYYMIFLKKWVFKMGIHKAIIIQGVLFGVISGILSAHSLLLAKSAVELITRAILIRNIEDLKSFQTLLIIIMFLVIALTQVYFLNCGLKNCSTSILYPLIFCIYNIVNIFNGLIYYNQLDSLTKLQCFMIFAGTILVLLGVFALSWNTLSFNNITFNPNPSYHYPNSDSKSTISETTSLLSSASFSPTKANTFHLNTSTPIQKKTKTYLINNEETNIVYVGNNDEDSQYVSFGSPRNSPIIMQDTSLSEDSIPPNPLTPISPFRYSSLNYDLEHGDASDIKKKLNNKRVLSFEQNELLSQLKIGSLGSERE